MATQLHRDDKKITKLLRKRKWDKAVLAAVACAASEEGDPYVPGETVRKVALAASEGDDGALDTIVRVICQEFRDCAPPGITGDVETDATDAVAMIGPRAVPRLLPLLDDPRWVVASHAMTALGTAGDVSVLSRIAEIHSRTPSTRVAGGPVDMWGTEMRSAAFVACLNLFQSDPEGYTEQALAVDPEAREMLAVAASNVASDPPRGWDDERTARARALADELAGRRVPKSSDGSVVTEVLPPDDKGETRLAIEIDRGEVHRGEVVTGRVRLRSKVDRRITVPNARLSIALDGVVRDAITTGADGAARISVQIDDVGHHKISVVYEGGEAADGHRWLGAEQVYGVKVKP